MSVHDLCCIGYITQDKIVTTKNTIYMPGGTSFYFAHAIKHLNPNGFYWLQHWRPQTWASWKRYRKRALK